MLTPRVIALLVLLLATATGFAVSVALLGRSPKPSPRSAAPASVTPGNRSQPATVSPAPTAENVNAAVVVNATANTNAAPARQPSVGVLFAEQVSSVRQGDREWPTMTLFRVSGDQAPVSLATVGAVGDSPSGYLFSRDRQTLFVTFETTLRALDLSSGGFSDLLTTRWYIGSIVESPDGRELLVEEHDVSGATTAGVLHRLVIATKEDRIVSVSDDIAIYYPRAWRTDGRWLLSDNSGEYWLYDSQKETLRRTPRWETSQTAPRFLSVSPSGRLFAAVKDWVPDACNEYAGSAWSSFDLYDVATGAPLGTVGDAATPMQLIAYAPDDREVLYATFPAASAWGPACALPRPKTYFRQPVGGKPVPVSDGPTLAAQWGGQPEEASVVYDNEARTWRLVVGDRTVRTSKRSLHLIDQYYE